METTTTHADRMINGLDPSGMKVGGGSHLQIKIQDSGNLNVTGPHRLIGNGKLGIYP